MDLSFKHSRISDGLIDVILITTTPNEASEDTPLRLGNFPVHILIMVYTNCSVYYYSSVRRRRAWTSLCYIWCSSPHWTHPQHSHSGCSTATQLQVRLLKYDSQFVTCSTCRYKTDILGTDTFDLHINYKQNFAK